MTYSVREAVPADLAGVVRVLPRTTRHAEDGAYDFSLALGFEGEATGFRLYLR